MKKSLALLFAFSFLTFFSAMSQSKTALNHIAVYVSDLAKSTTFYKDIIGLDTVPEPFHDGKHTWFALEPTIKLHLIQGAKSNVMHDKNSHLCFTVPSVSQFIERLEKNHIEYESWAGEKGTFTTRVDGVKQIYFTDPDGSWIEINDAKK